MPTSMMGLIPMLIKWSFVLIWHPQRVSLMAMICISQKKINVVVHRREHLLVSREQNGRKL